MKAQLFFRLLIVLGIGLIFTFYLFSDKEQVEGDEKGYEEEIAEYRKQNESFLKNSPDSPIVDKNNFEGLAYFPLQKKFILEAQLEVYEAKESYPIVSNQGEEEEYIKFAQAHFTYKGKEHSLLLLKKSLSDPFLFLAFKDQTSGKESYGGGRYLNVPYQKGQETITLDFNRAYHPYCVHNDSYVCPLPPRENQLAFEVLAGEKLALGKSH